MTRSRVASEQSLSERRARRKQLEAEHAKDIAHKASAQRIRAIRAALGMTQRDFSYYLRVTINAVSNWENGKTLPSPLAEQSLRNMAIDHGLDLHTLKRFEP